MKTYLQAIELMAQSEERNDISLKDTSLEVIAELVKLYGGEIIVNTPSEERTPLISMRVNVGSCQVWAHCHTTNIALMLQIESFQGKRMSFVQGANLTIADNQYLILSAVNGAQTGQKEK